MDDFRGAGPHAVAVEDGAWHDAGRERTLRWRHYRPLGADGWPANGNPPLVLHSHGLGGSCGSGAGWLRHWASWGIAGLAVQHPGSDADARSSDSPWALRHLLRTAVDAGQLAARQQDLLFALDRVAEAEPAAIGISGHSFGAVSALRLLGERRGRDDRPADPRVAAAVLFSPSARGGRLPLAERFADVVAPCLHLTGSRDDGIGPGDIVAADRHLPYANMTAAGQYLLVVDGAGHVDLSGDAQADTRGDGLLRAASTAFLLAHLGNRESAASWFRDVLPASLLPTDRLLARPARKVG